MFKFKKITSLVTTSLLLATTLAGCSTAKPVPTSSAGAASKLAPYEITWYMVSDPQSDADLVFQKVNEYTKKKINATVKLVQVGWGDYDKKLPLILASGEPLDICFTANWLNNYQSNAIKGAFLPIDDLLTKYGKNLLKLTPKAAFDGARVKGKIYGVPVNKEFAAQWDLEYNVALAEKYNLDMTKITKLEDLEPMLKIIKEKEKDILPIKITKDILNPTALLPFDVQNSKIPIGQMVENGDGKFFNVLEKPETKAIYSLFRKYYNAGYLQKDVATISDTSAIDKTGKWFATILSSKPGKAIEDSRSLSMKVETVHLTQPVISGSTGAVQAIAKASKNPQRAMMFLDLLNSDKYLLNLVDFGIEGKHYTKVGDNTYQLTPENSGKSTLYTMGAWAIGNNYLQFLSKDDPADKWEQYSKFNLSAKTSPLSGFTFDSTAVKNEWAACTNAYDEFIPAISLGAVDTDTYMAKAIAKFKNNGIDKIITEMQTQYDAWKTTK